MSAVRFLLDLDIAATKITIPTEFYPDGQHATKLLLDLGNLTIRTKVGTLLFRNCKRSVFNGI